MTADTLKYLITNAKRVGAEVRIDPDELDKMAKLFASQAVEDYKEKLKEVFLEEPNGTVNLGRFLKLIDSIK